MTRKQALQKALEVLKDKEAIVKINEIFEDIPFTGWSERTIFDTIDQFVIDSGKNPTTTDFKKKGMPSHTVIKLRFNINLKEFLEKYYPQQNELCYSKIYGHKTKEEWKEVFINEYLKLKPRGADDYNKNRDKENPSWVTVAKMFNIKKWLIWLDYCNLNCKRECSKNSKQKIYLNIKSHYDI